jgi:hypothetical protein
MTSNLVRRCLFLLAAFGIPASAQLVYQINTTPPTTLNPGSTVTFPTTLVGSQANLVIQVTNSGAVNAIVNSISVTGAAFQLPSPPVLPATLLPNGSVTFILTFAPAQAGTANGSLLINSNTFLLSGAGLASPLVFSYATAGTTITLSATNTSVVFSPVAIGQSAQLVFDVKNAGTSPVVISNIGIGQTGSPFSLAGLPALPVNLAPGVDFQFTITFQPTALGFSNGTLQLDTTSISLIASGTAPPTLPSYTISGVSGQVAPRSQPKISLTLGSPYPVAISGTLTLTTFGTLPNDPAVQFASGGQTVPFVIPANSTGAVFGSSGTGIGFQTGTVASTITFTPSFATQAGQVNLTPATPTTLKVTVAAAVPTLIGIQLTNETANGFSIVVTGFATTRTLTAWTVQFATVPGFVMAQSQFTINIQTVGTVWFQSTASQAFGGQFAITVPFTFQGTLPTGASVLSALASVSVNVNNELGSSNTVQAALQ